MLLEQYSIGMNTKNSILKGNACTYLMNENDKGTIDLQMTNGSQWLMQPTNYGKTKGRNHITQLAIDAGATIDMTASSDWQGLVIEDKLSGSGFYRQNRHQKR